MAATPVTGQASYLYDGDGNLARGIVNGVVTFYPGRHYNRAVDGANVTVKKFYTLGSSTVAVRTVQGSNDTLNWILSDHLGSASVTANADGTWNSEIKYTAFGEVRASYGLTPTDYRYTGQLEQAELGLVYFVARFYDPVLTHFVQADTLIPDTGDPLAWDRYAYSSNNPVNYTDPSGHCAISASTFMSPFGVFGFYASCVQDVVDAYNAYQEGVTDPGLLYLEATGVKDAIVSQAEDVHQLNKDVSTVFSNAPLEERIGPSIHVGKFAVGTAATIVGGAQMVKAGLETISVKTPYGRAWQSLDPDALLLRRQVSNGAEIYRGGLLGKTNVAEGQFWAPENPLNPGYASRYGAGSYSGPPDFVIGGNLKPGIPFITRPAPGVGSNVGGALEIVTRANGVHINFFFMR